VPAAVEATEATPSPAPLSTNPATRSSGRPPDAVMVESAAAPSPTPSRPAAMARRVPSRRTSASLAPASDPATTATLKGATVRPTRVGG